ncbi:MAG TPA: hypothetical protein VK427_02285 [Kofleriaceae bacterium]|nr:hypothetical protein [Kofleriaceae bacterium]
MRAVLAVLLFATACTNDPLYIPGPMALEAGTEAMMIAQSSLTLPIKLETADDAAKRAARAAELMVEVPYVRVGDIEVSVEWTVTNLTAEEGQFTLQLNGANEYFAYDPVTAAIGLDDNDPRPPGLDGDTPIRVLGKASVSGLFREDQLREASVDLDQITRGNFHPFRATLTTSKNMTQYGQLAPATFDEDGEPLPQPMTGVVFPREAWPQIVRIDLVFKPKQAMRLEYTVRVRDVRGIMHELLGAAATDAPGELTTFTPAVYMPPLP